MKARAALKGQTMKAFFMEAIREKLSAESSPESGRSGWRSVFGKVPKSTVAGVQALIDEEFSKINAEDWK